MVPINIYYLTHKIENKQISQFCIMKQYWDITNVKYLYIYNIFYNILLRIKLKLTSDSGKKYEVDVG